MANIQFIADYSVVNFAETVVIILSQRSKQQYLPHKSHFLPPTEMKY